MSFGFSIGDFIAVVKLANGLRKQFIGAPRQFEAISQDVKTLSRVLQDVEDLIEHDDDIADNRRNELQQISEAAQSILKALQQHLLRFRELDATTGKAKKLRIAWKRLQWDEGDIERYQHQLSLNITAFNAFLQCITSDAVFDIKTYITDVQANIKDIKLSTEGIHRDTVEIKSATEDIKDNTYRLQEQRDAEEQAKERRDILSFLSQLDHESQQSDVFSKRQPRTGSWFLDSTEFQSWLQPDSILLCTGIPGAGKTVIASVVINYLRTVFERDRKVGVCFLYFSYQPKQEQMLPELLGSLIKQLTARLDNIPSEIRDLYQISKIRHQRPSLNDYTSGLKAAIGCFETVYVVIDALDELYVSNRADLNSLLSALFQVRSVTKFNLAVTSRYISEITSQFKECLQKDILAQEDDVKAYIDSNISHLRASITKHKEARGLIQGAVAQAAKGMFLLARLHMETLKSQTTIGGLKRALKKLPQGIDGTYDEAMRRINGQTEEESSLARKVLTWIIYAKRPLSPSELQEAVAIQFGTTDMDADFLPELDDLDSICAGLVTIDSNSRIVRLVHYTTREYFEHSTWFPDPHKYLVQACTTYLSYDCFKAENRVTRTNFNLALYKYAAECWGLHAQQTSSKAWYDSAFLQNFALATRTVYYTRYSTNLTYRRNRLARGCLGVHLTALWGLCDAMTTLIAQGQSPNLRDSKGRTPLWYAASNTSSSQTLQVATANTLIEVHGADLSIAEYAIVNRQPSIFKVLFQSSGTVRANSDLIFTLFSTAMQMGKVPIDILRTLLDFAEVDRKHLPWQESLKRGYVELNNWVSSTTNSDDSHDGKNDHTNAYSRTACRWLELRICKSHVEVGGRPVKGLRPLTFYAAQGRGDVVGLLISKGVNVDTPDPYGRTALFYAAMQSCKDSIKYLIKAGASVDAEDVKGRTPLSYAVALEWPLLPHLEYLLSAGANANQADKKGRTPLWHAVAATNFDVAKLLLEKGRAIPDAQCLATATIQRHIRLDVAAIYQVMKGRFTDTAPEASRMQRPRRRSTQVDDARGWRQWAWKEAVRKSRVQMARIPVQPATFRTNHPSSIVLFDQVDKHIDRWTGPVLLPAERRKTARKVKSFGSLGPIARTKSQIQGR